VTSWLNENGNGPYEDEIDAYPNKLKSHVNFNPCIVIDQSRLTKPNCRCGKIQSYGRLRRLEQPMESPDYPLQIQGPE
jgi:hypothetical protein